jgi:23S rRNA (guanine2445-N2)-methyltransferase / 23S rRNA (guanine2069-N7)-methyltransferase
MDKCLASCSRGLAPLLADELRSFGFVVKEAPHGVWFWGGLPAAYKAVLWSRLASRVMLTLVEGVVNSETDMTDLLRSVDWSQWLKPQGSLAIEFHGKLPFIRHTQFGAQKVKDIIADWYREQTGQRPSVDADAPDLRLQAWADHGQFSIAVDMSGYGLHARGYRLEAGAAPMRETLAAGLLMKSGWLDIARAGGALVDPMCGSATLLIEGAWMAADVAPGLIKQQQVGFRRHANYDAYLWTELVTEAKLRAADGLRHLPRLIGFDHNQWVLKKAQENVRRAGLQDHIALAPLALGQWRNEGWQSGLVIVNPPYGERLGEVEALKSTYQLLGKTLLAECNGWQAAIYTSNESLGHWLGLRAEKMHAFANGSLDGKLLRLTLRADAVKQAPIDIDLNLVANVCAHRADLAQSEGAQMFANRLRKNFKQFEKQAKKEAVFAYRVYDADMPEYAYAIDLYHGEQQDWVQIQEYAPPRSVDEKAARRRLFEAMSVVPSVLGVDASHCHFKRRQVHKRNSQYQAQSDQHLFDWVKEGNCRFLVDLTGYLDTGLFLDHRPIRQWLAQQAKGKHCLNLFCYTGSASVHMAKGGAASVTSIDLSNTYLGWAQENAAENELPLANQKLYWERDDVLDWLKAMADLPDHARPRYDLIFCDPPSFSNSKKMAGTLDVQRDHVRMIADMGMLLAKDGILVFSTNLRGFKLDMAAMQAMGWQVTEMTKMSLGFDFIRNAKIHQIWGLQIPD